MIIKVMPDGDYPAAFVEVSGKKYPAVVGRNGVISAKEKKEGDGMTPLGRFRVLGGYYRPDRMDCPVGVVSLKALEPVDVWVDDPNSPKYNQPTKKAELAGEVSHETIWRDDHLYDIVLDLDYNRTEIVPGKGSAIFMHVARDQENPKNTPTAGCIALSRQDLIEVLSQIDENEDIFVEIVG